jgi:hypothetical protein
LAAFWARYWEAVADPDCMSPPRVEVVLTPVTRLLFPVLDGEAAVVDGTTTPGGAFPATIGCRWDVGWLGRGKPHRFKHSSVPAATLSGIYER